MSTIIKKGHELTKPWLKKVLECRQCECMFMLNIGDNVLQNCRRDNCFRDDYGVSCPIHFVATCPNCKSEIDFETDR